MSKVLQISTCALPPYLASWRSLVSRSIAAWEEMHPEDHVHKRFGKELLESSHTLHDFLPPTACPGPTFWFFQTRSAFLSQDRLAKWSNSDLNEYILLAPSMLRREDCYFMSHFWRTREHPDPDGEYLRLSQAVLEKQDWKYIWVDWTCAPQSPRAPAEQIYFHRCLWTMSAIIRNCTFMWYYPPFEARLWILYEVVEYDLTSSGSKYGTEDVVTYIKHVDEMVQFGVCRTLHKHGYRCSNEYDWQLLTSWLQVLAILRRTGLNIICVRRLLDSLTWFNTAKRANIEGVVLDKEEGTLRLGGKVYTFKPFPRESFAYEVEHVT